MTHLLIILIFHLLLMISATLCLSVGKISCQKKKVFFTLVPKIVLGINVLKLLFFDAFPYFPNFISTLIKDLELAINFVIEVLKYSLSLHGRKFGNYSRFLYQFNEGKNRKKKRKCRKISSHFKHKSESMQLILDLILLLISYKFLSIFFCLFCRFL